MNQEIPGALWSTERAMLDEITTDLRAVTIEVSDDIQIRFVYDRPIDEDLREVASAVEGYVLGDYPDHVAVEAVAETQMDGPITLTTSEVPIYHRRESEPLNPSVVSAHPGGRPDFLQDGTTWKPHVARQALGRLAVQKALLGEVSPDLRAVTVAGVDGVHVRLIYDHPIDAEIDATATRVDAATRANLHLDTTITTYAESVLDGPIPITEAEWPAFHRTEAKGWVEIQIP